MKRLLLVAVLATVGFNSQSKDLTTEDYLKLGLPKTVDIMKSEFNMEIFDMFPYAIGKETKSNKRAALEAYNQMVIEKNSAKRR